MDSVDFDTDFADFDADFDEESVDFDTDFVDFDADFVYFTDFDLKLVKLTISFHSTVRIQGETSVFLKIHRFCQNLQNPWTLPKPTVFHKIRGFPHISLNLQEDNIYVKQNTAFLRR